MADVAAVAASREASTAIAQAIDDLSWLHGETRCQIVMLDALESWPSRPATVYALDSYRGRSRLNVALGIAVRNKISARFVVNATDDTGKSAGLTALRLMIDGPPDELENEIEQIALDTFATCQPPPSCLILDRAALVVHALFLINEPVPETVMGSVDSMAGVFLPMPHLPSWHGEADRLGRASELIKVSGQRYPLHALTNL